MPGMGLHKSSWIGCRLGPNSILLRSTCSMLSQDSQRQVEAPLGEENGHGMAGCSSPTCGKGFDPPHMLNIEHIWKYHQGMWTRHLQSIFKVWLKLRHVAAAIPIGSMYAKYGNIYHQYTPNISIYTIHGSYGIDLHVLVVPWRFNTLRHLNMGVANTEWIWR